MDEGLNYIVTELEKGVDKETIRAALLSNGWTEEAITEAFDEIARQIALTEEPATPVPPPPSLVRPILTNPLDIFRGIPATFQALDFRLKAKIIGGFAVLLAGLLLVMFTSLHGDFPVANVPAAPQPLLAKEPSVAQTTSGQGISEPSVDTKLGGTPLTKEEADSIYKAFLLRGGDKSKEIMEELKAQVLPEYTAAPSQFLAYQQKENLLFDSIAKDLLTPESYRAVKNEQFQLLWPLFYQSKDIALASIPSAGETQTLRFLAIATTTDPNRIAGNQFLKAQALMSFDLVKIDGVWKADIITPHLPNGRVEKDMGGDVTGGIQGIYLLTQQALTNHIPSLEVRARDNKRTATLFSIQLHLDEYYRSNGTYPSSLSSLDSKITEFITGGSNTYRSEYFYEPLISKDVKRSCNPSNTKCHAYHLGASLEDQYSGVFLRSSAIAHNIIDVNKDNNVLGCFNEKGRHCYDFFGVSMGSLPAPDKIYKNDNGEVNSENITLGMLKKQVESLLEKQKISYQRGPSAMNVARYGGEDFSLCRYDCFLTDSSLEICFKDQKVISVSPDDLALHKLKISAPNCDPQEGQDICLAKDFIDNNGYQKTAFCY